VYCCPPCFHLKHTPSYVRRSTYPTRGEIHVATVLTPSVRFPSAPQTPGGPTYGSVPTRLRTYLVLCAPAVPIPKISTDFTRVRRRVAHQHISYARVLIGASRRTNTTNTSISTLRDTHFCVFRLNLKNFCYILNCL
jgi:hypothetical protein